MAVSASVVIPNLSSPLVGRTLAGLRSMGLPNDDVEVIVVGRDTLNLVPRDGHVRFIDSGVDLNPAAARNVGVREASGEQILFIDADCCPLPGWADALRRGLESSPVVGGSVTFPRQGNMWALADNIASFSEMVGNGNATSGEPFLGTLNLAVRRSAWEAVGPFDEHLPTSEDVDWLLRARALGLTTAFVSDAVVEHAAVRDSRARLIEHATWYGTSFHAFRARHPGVLDRGWAWREKWRLALATVPKAVMGTSSIFLRQAQLRRDAARAVPGVLLFKLAWYRAVLRSWP